MREAAELSGGERYIFPKLGSPLKPMCENAVNGALRRMGYGPDNMTAHGFRSTASSLLNESGKWSADAIKRALSHADGNQVRAAYHHGAHWPERVEMAQWWSDRLDSLTGGAKVLAFEPHRRTKGRDWRQGSSRWRMTAMGGKRTVAPPARLTAFGRNRTIRFEQLTIASGRS